jgi:hypothetical protein
MPNDAKLGLVVGVALVIAVAVLFYRKDATPGPPAPGEDPGTIVTRGFSTARPPRASYLPRQVRAVARDGETAANKRSMPQ